MTTAARLTGWTIAIALVAAGPIAILLEGTAP